MAEASLAGVRVVDCSTVLAGPLACQILGDFGADVIKIEHPTAGDSLRGHGHQAQGIGLWWKVVGRNKRNVGIDLHDPDGVQLVKQIASEADIFVENFRPGTLEKWGLGYDALSEANPGLVMVRVTGFGQEGPYSERPGFGTLAESMSGFAAMTGEPDGPPTLPPFGLADSISGMAAALGALMALRHRDRTGHGQIVDCSILEAMTSALGPQPTYYQHTGRVPERTGNRSVNNAPRNLYQTADGHWVALSSSANTVARRVMTLVGRPDVVDEEWFQTGAGRVEHADELDSAVAAWIGERTRDEVNRIFDENQIANSPVYNIDDLYNDPHVRATNMITTVPDEELGPLEMLNTLVRLVDTPGEIRWTGRPLGADSKEILVEELGLSEDKYHELRSRGVIK